MPIKLSKMLIFNFLVYDLSPLSRLAEQVISSRNLVVSSRNLMVSSRYLMVSSRNLVALSCY